MIEGVAMAIISVPPITQRARIPQEAIDDVVQQIITKFHPNKIMLFGSYARGNPRPESDVDLLVIMELKNSENCQMRAIRQSLEMDMFGLDIIVRSPQDFADRVALGDWFLREILTEGKVLYESFDH
jgi:predicted nucleotidyltransferase